VFCVRYQLNADVFCRSVLIIWARYRFQSVNTVGEAVIVCVLGDPSALATGSLTPRFPTASRRSTPAAPNGAIQQIKFIAYLKLRTAKLCGRPGSMSASIWKAACSNGPSSVQAHCDRPPSTSFHCRPRLVIPPCICRNGMGKYEIRTGLLWTGTGCGCCEWGNEPPGSVKCGKFLS